MSLHRTFLQKTPSQQFQQSSIPKITQQNGSNDNSKLQKRVNKLFVLKTSRNLKTKYLMPEKEIPRTQRNRQTQLNEITLNQLLTKQFKDVNDDDEQREQYLLRRQKFLTKKDLLNHTQRSKQFMKKSNTFYNLSKDSTKSFAKSANKGTQYNQAKTPKNPTIELPQSLQHQNPSNTVHHLSHDISTFSSLWEKFLQKIEKLRTSEEINALTNVFEDEQKRKFLVESMKIMEYMLDQQENKITELASKASELNEDFIRGFYLQSHQLHKKYMDAKQEIQLHSASYEKYLNDLKEQERQKRLALQSKRELSVKNENEARKSPQRSASPQLNPKVSFPLKYLPNGINLMSKEIRQVIEKKSKLNLQLDLSFQIQQRKSIAKQKQEFSTKKIQLQKQKLQLQAKISALKQKIQLKEKEVERFEFQKQKLQHEREYFLKQLIVNGGDYRNDGLLWVWKKMIECGLELRDSDLAQLVDESGRRFLLQQWKIIKEKEIFRLKEEKQVYRKKFFRKEKKVQNRQRVKSVTVNKSSDNNQDQCSLGLLSRNISQHYQNRAQRYWTIPLNPNHSGLKMSIRGFPKQSKERQTEKGFFSFGSKLLHLQRPEEDVPISKIRKKSGSVIVLKTFEEESSHRQQSVTQHNPNSNRDTSFKSLTKHNNSKKIYESTKSYLKSWVNNQGWNMATARVPIAKHKEEKIPESLINQERARVKQKFWKVGRQNSKYKAIIQTLYGGDHQEEDKTQITRAQTARRVKTTR